MNIPDHNDTLHNLCLSVRPLLYRLVFYQTNDILEPAPALLEFRDPIILEFYQPLMRGPFLELPQGVLLLRMPLFQPHNLGLIGLPDSVHFFSPFLITPQINTITLCSIKKKLPYAVLFS